MESRDPPPRATPAWAEGLVRFLDDGITIPGTKYRIGYDGLIGLLLPGAGDALTATGALSLFFLAVKRGAPRIVLLRMALNVAIDTALGAVPFIGDLFDFAWKANRKNLRLIERVAERAEPRSFMDYLFVAALGVFVLGLVLLPVVLAVYLLAKLRA